MHINFSSFLQCRFNIYLFQKLGWTFTFVYIYLLGKLYFFIKLKEKRNIAAAIETVFSDRKNKLEVKSLTRAVFMGIFQHYYEKIFNAFSDVDNLKAFFNTHIKSSGTAVLDNALAEGKGVLLVTGHLGGVELMPLYLGFKNYPVTMVVKFTSNQLRIMSAQQAKEFSVEVIDPDKTTNVMSAILKSLKKNRIVITQCDEIDEWRLSRKDKLSFLGKQTFLDRTITVLSKRASAPVVFGIMRRDENHRYEFVATSWEKMAQGYQQPRDMPIGTVVLKFLEQHIYMHPEEWYQWKKYPAIETVPLAIVPARAPSSIPFLEPSLEKAA